jgi:predicted Zn-dependent protease
VEAYARFATGIIYDLNNDPGEATEQFLRSVMADPSNKPLVVEVSRRLLRNNRSEQAIELLERAVEKSEADATIYSLLGLAYTQQGTRKPAREAFREAIQRAPDSLIAYQNLIHLYIQEGRVGPALDRMTQARRDNAEGAEFLIGLASSMNYIRQLPEDQLNRLRLLVMPSEPTEGLPTTILEAFACGTPVYATPVSGVPDVVVEGETGFLMTEDTPEAIAGRIEEIMGRDDLAAIGANARRLVEEEYDYEATVARYREMLTGITQASTP